MSSGEVVALLDKQQNVIGYKERQDLDDDDCWRCACVCIENDRGQVLVQQRSFDKKIDPGLWTIGATGTVTGDDDYEETAYREVEEEVGLAGHTLTPTNRLLTRASFGWRWNQGYKTVCNWPVEKFKAQSSEVISLEWRDRREVIQSILNGDPAYAKTTPSWVELFDLHYD